MDEKQRYALVTGGSSGIGMEFSKLLAQDGYNLIIVAKPQEELDQAKIWFEKNMPGTQVEYVKQDLAVTGAANKIHDYTKNKGYFIDIFINNAGFATFGWYHEIDMEREKVMINLNVMAVYELTRLYLDDMVKKDSGKILITSSTVAFAPSPKFTTYAATKAFSHYFGLGLGQELKDLGSKVSITVLNPPSTRTGFQHTANMDSLKLFDRSNKLTKDPDFVALKAYEALKKGKMFVIPGAPARILLQIFNPMARRGVVRRLMGLSEWGLK